MDILTNEREEFEQRLLRIMENWSFPIDSYCRNDLVSQIRIAADRVEIEGAASDSSKVAEAEANFRLLLAEMTRLARNQRLNKLQEFTLRESLIKLCPLWPFC